MYEQNDIESRGQADTTPDHEKSEGDQDSETETETLIEITPDSDYSRKSRK